MREEGGGDEREKKDILVVWMREEMVVKKKGGVVDVCASYTASQTKFFLSIDLIDQVIDDSAGHL